MNEKPDKEPDETYVLDDETLEELDEASLSSLVNDLTNTMKRPQIDPTELEDEAADQPDQDGDGKGDPGE